MKWLKMVILDYGRFRECVYELIENDDTFLEEKNIEIATKLVKLFLEGKVAIYFDSIRSTLRWASI